MRHAQTRQSQIHNTDHALTQNKPARQHNHRRILPLPPNPPVTIDQPADGARERKRRHVVHAHRDRDPAGHPIHPCFAPAFDAQGGEAAEEEAGAESPLPCHWRQAHAGHESRGEDPDVARGHLEHAIGDLVDGGVELVDASGHDGAEEGADHLAPELRPRRCA